MRSFLSALLSLALIGIKHGAAQLLEAAQPPKMENKTLAQKLDQVMAADFNKDGLGGVLLIAQHGAIVYEKAVGKANMELNIPLSTANVFRIGSITKQFT